MKGMGDNQTLRYNSFSLQLFQNLFDGFPDPGYHCVLGSVHHCDGNLVYVTRNDRSHSVLTRKYCCHLAVLR